MKCSAKLTAAALLALGSSARASAETPDIAITGMTCDYDRSATKGSRLRDHGPLGSKGYAIVATVSAPPGKIVAVGFADDEGSETLPAAENVSCFEPTDSGLASMSDVGTDDGRSQKAAGEYKVRIQVDDCAAMGKKAVAYYAPYKNMGECVVSEPVTLGKLLGVKAVLRLTSSAMTESHVKAVVREAVHAIDAKDAAAVDAMVSVEITAGADGYVPISQVKLSTEAAAVNADPTPGVTYATVEIASNGGDTADFEAAKAMLRELRKGFAKDGQSKGLGRKARSQVLADVLDDADGAHGGITLVDSDLWRYAGCKNNPTLSSTECKQLYECQKDSYTWVLKQDFGESPDPLTSCPVMKNANGDDMCGNEREDDVCMYNLDGCATKSFGPGYCGDTEPDDSVRRHISLSDLDTKYPKLEGWCSNNPDDFPFSAYYCLYDQSHTADSESYDDWKADFKAAVAAGDLIDDLDHFVDALKEYHGEDSHFCTDGNPSDNFYKYMEETYGFYMPQNSGDTGCPGHPDLASFGYTGCRGFVCTDEVL